ncbi:FtsW/RodA/SpoVE family cell cycle protein [Antrihabitans cavernicola]|uniref:FtsW/RodA/SpoVE family cell cycle protein n=1 Tax=Antrihabitans cavernicola TaxID=2495913 RepID=A0A5A7S982_9NOCA|nr:FtsW/RodA/SpoVE family cell cycle protein [Spelaeibacter cavernicola]KAA0021193.1 FtsW/RodA/SpoVE family cell cycle protein [Spelaeibacter cavernicola]
MINAIRGRNSELALLVLALTTTGVAWALMDFGRGVGIDDYVYRYLAIFAALALVAHLVVRRFAAAADPVILPCVTLLNGLGLVFIDRLDHAEATDAAAGTPLPSPDAPHQLVWMALGIVLFSAVLIAVRDHRSLASYAYTCGLAGLLLLLVPAVLPSRFSEVNGGKSWVRFHGFSVQPGEFAKVLLLIFVAAYLVQHRELFTIAGRRVLGMTFPRLRDLAPLLLASGVAIVVLVVEENLGFSLLIFGTILAMIYIATDRVSWLVVGLLMFAVGCVIAYNLFAHVRVRVDVWRDPFSTYYGNGYQIAQSLFGLGTGGMLGTGLGAGRPQAVPFAKTDFIISTIGEELGLIGLTAVIVLFLVITIRGFKTSLAVHDSFGTLLTGGLAFSIGWQLFVVVGGVTKLIPLTGITTPFMSYGGSSLLANYIVIAILLRVSDEARTHPPPAVRKPVHPISEAETQIVHRPLT